MAKYPKEIKKINEAKNCWQCVLCTSKMELLPARLAKLEDVSESRFPELEIGRIPLLDDSHVAMNVNLDACIQCNLCVRACREVQVNDVIGLANIRSTIVQMSFDLFSRTPRIYLEVTGSKGTIIWDRVDHSIKIYNRKLDKWKTESQL